MTIPKPINHGDLHRGSHEEEGYVAVKEEAHPAQGHMGHRGHRGHRGHQRAAALGLTVAKGTIKSISGTSFVLTTKQGDLTVTTSADTNFHGLSRRQAREAREAGYQDLAIINTFAGLMDGQRVGVIGERQDDTTLLAKGVHFPVPTRFGEL